MLPFLTLFAANTTCQFRHGISSFLNFPTWYEYMPGVVDPATGKCEPQLGSLSNIWLILAAVIEILLRIAALVAIAMVIYGGIKYVTSQGEPEATTNARNTIINALVGLLLSITAAAFITFIAGRFTT